MEEERFIYADDSDYPEIGIQEKNRQYAAAMLSNIGSCNSEMSAVSLYFYNSVITGGRFDEISDCFRKISLVEMHHLHIFASLANLLGADPQLWSVERGRYRYWSPSCNRYCRNIAELLRGAIQGEEQAIAKYTKQMGWIADCNIQRQLARIILDEKCHIRIFERLCDKYVR